MHYFWIPFKSQRSQKSQCSVPRHWKKDQYLRVDYNVPVCICIKENACCHFAWFVPKMMLLSACVALLIHRLLQRKKKEIIQFCMNYYKFYSLLLCPILFCKMIWENFVITKKNVIMLVNNDFYTDRGISAVLIVQNYHTYYLKQQL